MTLHQYMLKKTKEYAETGQLGSLYNLGYAKGRWDAAKAYCGTITKQNVSINSNEPHLLEIAQFLEYEDI